MKLYTAEEFREMIESMIESMAEGVFMIDERGEIVVINPQAQRMLGFEFKEKITTGALEEKLRAVGLGKGIEDCRKRNDLVTKEITVPSYVGGRILRCDITPVKGAEGRILGIVTILTDITAEKELDRIKGEFISTVSHEIRTPLSIIKEGIGLVLDRIPGKINEKQDNILVAVGDNIDRLNRIISNLIDMSKIEAGKISVKKESVNLTALVKSVAFSFQPRIKGKRLRLILDVPEEEINVYADRDRVIQVFTNLLDNSLKFTLKGHLGISVVVRGDEVECSVRDTGVGISKEDLPRAFDRFQQFGRVEGGGAKGTGLGLAIAREIIEMHHGRIWVESEPGKGTKVAFTLFKYSDEQVLKGYFNDGIKAAIKEEVEVSFIGIYVAGPEKEKMKLAAGEVRAVIKDIENIIQEKVRYEEDGVMDYDGWIFVRLHRCGKEAVLEVQYRLQRALDEYLGREKMRDRVAFRLGRATFPDEGESAVELIRKVTGPWAALP